MTSPRGYLCMMRVAPPERQLSPHGCCSVDKHDENMHFSVSPIHYSHSHRAQTYQNNRKLTTGDDRCVCPCLYISGCTFCISVYNFTMSLQLACSPKMARWIKTLRTKIALSQASWFAWLTTPLTFFEWHDTIWEMMNTAARQLYQRWRQ